MKHMFDKMSSILSHIFTATFFKQNEENPAIGEFNRTNEDFNNVRDGFAHMINCGYVISKVPKDATFLILQATEDESSDLYGFAYTSKIAPIEGLEESDIMHWNPNIPEGSEEVNTAYMDIKANSSIIIHNKNAQIKLLQTGEIALGNQWHC